jgi:ABC-type dipeptide/oligopeptide/nickel transport system ATPase component
LEYNECKILCTLEKEKTPLKTVVPVDEFTKKLELNFDYDFNGENIVYPYKYPEILDNIDYKILCIVGASGSGKSTLIKKFPFYKENNKQFNNEKAIVSNFNNFEEASEKLIAVGLSSLPIWSRPRNVLSIGEAFRADLALNLDSYSVFDEFTSTVDRNVAKSTCCSISKYINNKELTHIVFSSCHKDFISYLNPDIVIDLDDEKIYDCRGIDLKKELLSKYTNQQTKIFGEYLGNITI